MPNINDFPVAAFASIAAVFVLAGMVKGVVGLGLPTIAMGLLALFMPSAQAAALLIVPSLVTNVWQIRPWLASVPLWRALGPMQAGVVVGTLGMAAGMGAPAGTWPRIGLGVALLAYAAWGLSGAKFTISAGHRVWAGPAIGVLTGMTTAATGVFVIPAVPYLQALDLKRDALIQALGISFTVSTIALAIGLNMNGEYAVADAGASLLMLLPALIGMAIGQGIRGRLSQTLFKRCFFASLSLLGLHMVLREVMAAAG